jgi:hypothetical protein
MIGSKTLTFTTLSPTMMDTTTITAIGTIRSSVLLTSLSQMNHRFKKLSKLTWSTSR